ncbi:MAG: GSU2403 family nucleotidyltransferase fold protein [Deltaproteobacteria bacterium]
MPESSRSQEIRQIFPDHTGRIMTALCDVGFFERSVLIGSWAMFCYGVTLGVKWQLHTGDIDLAVEVISSGKESRVDLEKVLQEAGATPFFSSSDGLIRFSIPDYRIEFIVHDYRGGRKRESEIVRISDWNINAQPLPFIQVLLDFSERVDADDFYIHIPIPEAFFFHKLIVAQRRQKEEKRIKDLGQCEVLSGFIEDEKLRQVIKAQKIGKETKRKIQASCKFINFPYARLGI